MRARIIEIEGQEDPESLQLREIEENRELPCETTELVCSFLRAVESAPGQFCGSRWRGPYGMLMRRLRGLNTPFDERVAETQVEIAGLVLGFIHVRVGSIH